MNRRVAGRLLVVAILAATPAVLSQPAPAPTTATTWVPVPGGIAAIARLLGPIDQDPAAFVLSLNELLLGTTQTDHDWQAVPLRHDLVRFLDIVAELRQRFPGPITIGAGDSERRALERLAGALGFTLEHDRRRGYQLVPRNGNERDGDQAFRRTVAQALGLQLEDLTAGLNAGATATVTIPTDRAVAPVPPAVWQAITGRPLDGDALAILAKDQRLSLLLEGRRRLSVESRHSFDQMDLQRFYRNAPFSLRRYASSFRIRDGRMVAPGGEPALPVWSGLIGVSPDSPEAFLRQLLETLDAKRAYLWHSFHHAPPAAIDLYLHRGSVDRRLRFAGEVFAQLDGSGASAFDGALAGELGFAAFARAVPITGDPPRLDLPGGPGLWSAAIQGDLPPANLDELAQVVRRGSARELDETELLLAVLRVKVNRPGPDQDAMPRLIRGVNLFRQHPALYSPETVVLAARSADLAAPALQALDVIPLRDPEVARDYLLTVSRLQRLDLDWPREQLVMAFQGGVEWLRSMGAAGRVDGAVLERHLESWSGIHFRHDDADASAPEQLSWLAAVLRELPPAPDQAPGRGPLERAMLQALVPSTEPDFSWKGLTYDSHRPSQLAARMAGNLEFFGVPSADQLASLDDTLVALARGCREEDLDTARRAAAALRNLIAALPGPRTPTAIRDPEIARRLHNAERDEVLTLASEILRRKKAKGLAGLAPRVEASSRHLAVDLRPFLLAPAYLAVLATDRGSLLQDRDLVRKHRLVPTTILRQRAWTEATVERDQQGDLGSWLCGHLGTVDGAMASFTLSGTELRAVDGLDQRRARAWYHHWAATPWQRMAPAVTAAVARVLALGESLVDLASQEAAATGRGPHLDLVASLVPYARLEAAALRPEAVVVSPSEGLMVGLAALERTAPDAALSGVDAATLAAARDATRALGADWRERLELAGAATPALNGRGSPSLGWWPSYEAVEFDRFTAALVERELVDLHLLVIDYLGRHGLPGFIGSDLMRRTMEQLASTLILGHDRDWMSVLRGLRRIDDAFFDARLRECLRDDLYRLRDS